MCIGERIHTVRFGGKVFGQVQGDAAAGSLSPVSLALRSPLCLAPASSRFLLPPSRGETFSSSSSFLPLPLSLCLQRSPVGTARFVSFRFSSLGISLQCARGDLGARPPTRELVNYFAQRDIVFGSPSPLFLSLSPSLPPSTSLFSFLSFCPFCSILRFPKRRVAPCTFASMCNPDTRRRFP